MQCFLLNNEKQTSELDVNSFYKIKKGNFMKHSSDRVQKKLIQSSPWNSVSMAAMLKAVKLKPNPFKSGVSFWVHFHRQCPCHCTVCQGKCFEPRNCLTENQTAWLVVLHHNQLHVHPAHKNIKLSYNNKQKSCGQTVYLLTFLLSLLCCLNRKILYMPI